MEGVLQLSSMVCEFGLKMLDRAKGLKASESPGVYDTTPCPWADPEMNIIRMCTQCAGAGSTG